MEIYRPAFLKKISLNHLGWKIVSASSTNKPPTAHSNIYIFYDRVNWAPACIQSYWGTLGDRGEAKGMDGETPTENIILSKLLMCKFYGLHIQRSGQYRNLARDSLRGLTPHL